jgi:hypothetical protein
MYDKYKSFRDLIEARIQNVEFEKYKFYNKEEKKGIDFCIANSEKNFIDFNNNKYFDDGKNVLFIAHGESSEKNLSYSECLKKLDQEEQKYRNENQLSMEYLNKNEDFTLDYIVSIIISHLKNHNENFYGIVEEDKFNYNDFIESWCDHNEYFNQFIIENEDHIWNDIQKALKEKNMIF